jgi:ATP-dependent DNA ligase
LRTGYSLNTEANSEVLLPMKVKIFQQQLKNIVFPAISTPKYNGIHGTYRLENNTLNLYSRGGLLYPPIPHLESEIMLVMKFLNVTEVVGELYVRNEALQDITSAVKKPKELSKQLEFCLFDIDMDCDYKCRRSMLFKLTDAPISFEHIVFVTGTEVNSMQDIENHYNLCMVNGYEGTVIKNYKGMNVHNTRSSDQFKYKKTQSAEFKVVGYNRDKRNHPVFILESEGGEFKAKPKMSHKELAAINPDEYVGKWATIEFETLSKDQKPLKPIFIALRSCNKFGKPIE